MTQNKFSRPTISTADKEKKAEEFIGFMDKVADEKTKERTTEKEDTHLFSFRIPISLFDDMKEISALSRISLNSICLDAIRSCVKKKLKELKEDE
jgi:hypothetical protein